MFEDLVKDSFIGVALNTDLRIFKEKKIETERDDSRVESRQNCLQLQETTERSQQP